MCKKDYFWNPATCSCENGKHLASITNDSVITCDEIIEETKTIPTKTVPTNFNEKKVTCKTKNFYISLTFLLITIELLIAVYYLLLPDKILSKTKTFITISHHK